MSDIVRLGPHPGWVSGSALSTAVKCAASLVLPRILGVSVSAGRIGSALHEHIRHRNLYGVAAAVDMLPELATRFDLDEDEEALFIARAKAFEWSPPRGAVAELALCLFEDGRVEAVHGGKGSYDLPPDALIPAQIDLFWSEPEPLFRDGDRMVCPPGSILFAVDFKSGKEDYVDPAERNAQALAGCILAAKYTGAELALPGIVFLRKGQGIWDLADHAFDRAGLAKVETVLRGAVLEVRRQREAYARGLPLVYREGPHCTFCRARHACPAHVATLKQWLSDPSPLSPGVISPDQISRLAELAPAFHRFARSVDAVLRAHVEETGQPIPMSDGRVWGPRTKNVEVLDPDKVIAALGEETSPEDALGAVTRRVSRSSIEEVIKAVHARKGITRKKASAIRAVYGRLLSSDGLHKVTRIEWGPSKPKPELPAIEERHAVLAALHGLPIDGDDIEEDAGDA